MKKLVFSVIILAALLVTLSAPLFAQKISEGKESEYFYVSVSLEKIYPYNKGYVVQYRKGGSQTAQAYLPLEWFTGTGTESDAKPKSEVLYLGAGKTWPYLAVYYRNGEFSHVRLFIRRSQSHETWGTIPMGTNIDERFENIGDLKLDF